jgi:HrpA-like RNA helicase
MDEESKKEAIKKRQQMIQEFIRQGDERERGAVLVFLPGLMEIDQIFKQLAEVSVTRAGYVLMILIKVRQTV